MDFMLDVETLGTKPGAVVLSVGAVSFDRETAMIKGEFYSAIDLRDSRKRGLVIDADTLIWWTKQGPEAIAKAFNDPKAHSLDRVVKEFKIWFQNERGRENAVWAQGQDFDLPIWGRAMAAVGERPPWEFWAGRDTRTVYDVTGFDQKSIPRKGTHHDALDDVRHQTRVLCAALATISTDDFLAA